MDRIVCNAEISIQGERVLRLVNCTQERAVYEVIGFNDPSITIIDYRKNGLRALQTLLDTGEAKNFAPKFNMPARVEFQYAQDGNVLIELNEVGNDQPIQMLWIVVGLQDSIPVYDYLFETIAPLDDNTFAFAALFNIPALSVDTHFSSDSTDSLGSSGCEYSR